MAKASIPDYARAAQQQSQFSSLGQRLAMANFSTERLNEVNRDHKLQRGEPTERFVITSFKLNTRKPQGGTHGPEPRFKKARKCRRRKIFQSRQVKRPTQLTARSSQENDKKNR